MKLQCTILLFGFILINASDENSQTSWHPSSFQVPGPLWGVRLRNHIAAWTSIPSDEVSRLRLLLDSQGWAEARELFSDKYLEKVLVAESRGRGTAVESAAERLSASLKWRREYGVAHIRKKDVARCVQLKFRQLPRISCFHQSVARPFSAQLMRGMPGRGEQSVGPKPHVLGVLGCARLPHPLRCACDLAATIPSSHMLPQRLRSSLRERVAEGLGRDSAGGDGGLGCVRPGGVPEGAR
eukprot:396553-Rhodomonas_salina.1